MRDQLWKHCEFQYLKQYNECYGKSRIVYLDMQQNNPFLPLENIGKCIIYSDDISCTRFDPNFSKFKWGSLSKYDVRRSVICRFIGGDDLNPYGIDEHSCNPTFGCVENECWINHRRETNSQKTYGFIPPSPPSK